MNNFESDEKKGLSKLIVTLVVFTGIFIFIWFLFDIAGTIVKNQSKAPAFDPQRYIIEEEPAAPASKVKK